MSMCQESLKYQDLRINLKETNQFSILSPVKGNNHNNTGENNMKITQMYAIPYFFVFMFIHLLIVRYFQTLFIPFMLKGVTHVKTWRI